MKKPEEMTDAELFARLGIPVDCPCDVADAFVRAMADRWTCDGIEAVKAAAREQEGWSRERKDEARLLSLRRLRSREGTL